MNFKRLNSLHNTKATNLACCADYKFKEELSRLKYRVFMIIRSGACFKLVFIVLK